MGDRGNRPGLGLRLDRRCNRLVLNRLPCDNFPRGRWRLKWKLMSAKSQCVRMALLWGAVGLLALSAAGPSFVRSSGEYGPLAVEGHFTRIKLPERSTTTDRNGSEQPKDLTEEEALLANRSLRFSAHPIETAWPFGPSPGVRLAE